MKRIHVALGVLMIAMTASIFATAHYSLNGAFWTVYENTRIGYRALLPKDPFDFHELSSNEPHLRDERYFIERERWNDLVELGKVSCFDIIEAVLPGESGAVGYSDTTNSEPPLIPRTTMTLEQYAENVFAEIRPVDVVEPLDINASKEFAGRKAFFFTMTQANNFPPFGAVQYQYILTESSTGVKCVISQPISHDAEGYGDVTELRNEWLHSFEWISTSK